MPSEDKSPNDRDSSGRLKGKKNKDCRKVRAPSEDKTPNDEDSPGKMID